MNAAEFGCHLPRPLLEDVVDGRSVVDGEGEVEVGPAVARTVREAADHSGGDHARIGLGHAEHVVAHAVSILDAEHEADARRPGRRLTSPRVGCDVPLKEESMHVTVTTADITGETIGDATVVGEEMERWLRDADGFEGFLLLAGETKAVGLAFWASREVAERHNHARTQFRERMLSIAGAEIEDVVDYEVAFARLGPGLIAAGTESER